MAKSRRDTADSYTLRARREGYPARSVYKLEEIQKQHKIIRKGNSVLDVGQLPVHGPCMYRERYSEIPAESWLSISTR